MRDVAATIASPAFRSWHDMLRIPNGIDKDVLLAAGVIKDDEDWLEWRDRGWLSFIVKAADEQAVALFELIKPPATAPDVPALLSQADVALHDRRDVHGSWAHDLVHQAGSLLNASPEIRAQAEEETRRMFAALRHPRAPTHFNGSAI